MSNLKGLGDVMVVNVEVSDLVSILEHSGSIKLQLNQQNFDSRVSSKNSVFHVLYSSTRILWDFFQKA